MLDSLYQMTLKLFVKYIFAEKCLDFVIYSCSLGCYGCYYIMLLNR